MLFIITVMMVVLVGLSSASGTMLGGYSWYLAFFNSVIQGFSGTLLLWIPQHSFPSVFLAICFTVGGLVVSALGFSILLTVIISVLYILTLASLYVIPSISPFIFLSFFRLTISSIGRLLALPTLFLKAIGHCRIFIKLACWFPFLATVTFLKDVHISLQNKTPLWRLLLIVVTRIGNAKGVKNYDTTGAMNKQLNYSRDNDIVAQVV